MEDGSRTGSWPKSIGAKADRLTSDTDNRIGSAEFTVPPNMKGPPAHWHEMHDETFLVTKGMIRFHVPDPENPGKDLKTVDAYEGDYVTVPTQ